jgi:16S rRNA (uracil1498-N3)-methyltransferase
LDPAQSRHALKVLRLKPGRGLEIAGPWGLAEGEIVDAAEALAEGGPDLTDRRSAADVVFVRMTGSFAAEPAETGPALALALIRGPRFDWAVEKAVELGASSLTPLITLRANSADPGPTKRARWVRLAEEARKQCGRSRPMRVASPSTLEEYLTGPLPADRFLLDPGSASRTLVPRPAAALLVGPEGGLTEEEKALAVAAGFLPVGLGPLILRAETAALVGLARLTG